MFRLLSGLLLACLTLAPAAAQERFTILFLGDSLTMGYGLDEGQSFPAMIERRFAAEGRDIRVLNAGVSGSTSASGLSRLAWYARSNPDLIVLSLGANDGLRGLSVAEMKANLAEIIETAQAGGMQVVLTGMLVPPNMGPEYSESFAAAFPELAETYGIPLLPFLLEGVAAVPELNQADGIHPNLEGTRRVADLVHDFLLPFLP